MRRANRSIQLDQVTAATYSPNPRDAEWLKRMAQIQPEWAAEVLVSWSSRSPQASGERDRQLDSRFRAPSQIP